MRHNGASTDITIAITILQLLVAIDSINNIMTTIIEVDPDRIILWSLSKIGIN